MIWNERKNESRSLNVAFQESCNKKLSITVLSHDGDVSTLTKSFKFI
jgi:hypothetical protein